MEVLAGLFHLGCGIFYIYGTYYDLQIITPHSTYYGGRWKYLTFLNLYLASRVSFDLPQKIEGDSASRMLQLFYFILAPLADLLTLLKGREDNWLVKLRDVVFSSLAFPLGVFVAATFWGIYMMDRELIFPRELDKIFPSWINHVLHTWCAVLVIVEAAFIQHKYPKNRVGLGLLAAFTVMYLVWIMWIAYAAEFWVYPFLRVMPNTARAAFFVVCGCIIAFLYFLGKWMTIFIWGGEGEKDSTRTKPKEATKKKAKKAD